MCERERERGGGRERSRDKESDSETWISHGHYAAREGTRSGTYRSVRLAPRSVCQAAGPAAPLLELGEGGEGEGSTPLFIHRLPPVGQN